MAFDKIPLIRTLFLLWCTLTLTLAQFEPTWDSLDSRPLPEWYDKAKIGIFLHWGVYSVPSYGTEWFWHGWRDGNEDYAKFMKDNYPPDFTYQDFAREFTAEFFDAAQWVDLFKNAGARYVVLTSKHHDGYALWPSKYSPNWNSQDVGPHRDLIDELGTAVKEANLTFGLYHSLFEWYHPLYEQDLGYNWTTSDFVDLKIIPEMKELINNYQPHILWSDGDWDAPDTYWKSTEFLAWLYNESPVKDVVVTNDRWGQDTACNHGGFFTCSDRFNPGHLLPRKWENAMTVDKVSWGYRRIAQLADILTTEELISTIVETVSCGGNILVNVGPTKEGTIIPIFQERLLEMGAWLKLNGEAIYEAQPWTMQNDTLTSGVWYTTKPPTIYATFLNWPPENLLVLDSARDLFNDTNTQVDLLGNESLKPLWWEVREDVVAVTLPDKAIVQSQWAWVLKITPNATHQSES